MPAANIESPAKAALGFIESAGLSITAVLADEAVKSAQVRLLGIETTGNERLMIRLLGQIGAIEAALAHVEMVAERLGVTTVNTSLAGPDPALDALITYPNSQNPLYGGRDQMIPDAQETPHNLAMKNEALGILETQGLTAILEATDAMLKAANVTLVGKEKIGAAYVTVMVRGDVAAVTAAIDAGSRAVGSLGKLIAAHVIPRPHEDLIALLPKPKP